jgi:Arc/MetJ-type ribon-helix-helix transcriptional regulator
MSTITVPLSAELMKMITDLIADGKAANKADLVRRALKKFAEDQAVADVLEAQKEPRLQGDLRKLAKAL